MVHLVVQVAAHQLQFCAYCTANVGFIEATFDCRYCGMAKCGEVHHRLCLTQDIESHFAPPSVCDMTCTQHRQGAFIVEQGFQGAC